MFKRFLKSLARTIILELLKDDGLIEQAIDEALKKALAKLGQDVGPGSTARIIEDWIRKHGK